MAPLRFYSPGTGRRRHERSGIHQNELCRAFVVSSTIEARDNLVHHAENRIEQSGRDGVTQFTEERLHVCRCDWVSHGYFAFFDLLADLFLLLCLLCSIIARCSHFQHLVVITNDFNQTGGHPALSDIAAYRNLRTNLQFLEIGTGSRLSRTTFTSAINAP
jgi:hypothetical protein